MEGAAGGRSVKKQGIDQAQGARYILQAELRIRDSTVSLRYLVRKWKTIESCQPTFYSILFSIRPYPLDDTMIQSLTILTDDKNTPSLKHTARRY
jgi:hypothetical protein